MHRPQGVTPFADFMASSPIAPCEVFAQEAPVRKAIVAVVQIAGLALLSWLGHVCAEYLRLPVPGNLIAMLMLLLLLSTGIVRLSWIEYGAKVLLAHLAFFFVPIAVGLMAFTDLLRSQGFAWLVTLFVAAGLGIVSAGFVTQALANHSLNDKTDRPVV
jgi:holin-like protein